MILIVDLETTCDEGDRLPANEMEIIEIGAVWSTVDGCLVDAFESLVRPVVHPVLTSFCMHLTGIAQHDVDAASLLPQVMLRFSAFVNREPSAGQVWASWGNYDRKQWRQDCVRHGLCDPMESFRHLNLKQRFAHTRNIKQVGMAKALEIVGLPLQGQHHRALSDAKNIASLLPWMGVNHDDSY